MPPQSVLFIYTYTFLKFLKFLTREEKDEVLETTPNEEFLIYSQTRNGDKQGICDLYHIFLSRNLNDTLQFSVVVLLSPYNIWT